MNRLVAQAEGTAAGSEESSLRTLVDRLRESEQRFRSMADCAPVLLWMAEPDALCSFFNKGWMEFTGRTLEQEVGSGWAEGVYFEDFQRCMDVYLDAFVERRPFRMEYRLRRHDGQYRWVLDTGVPRFTPSGQFAGYIGSCIDITDFKDAQLALRRVNEDLEQRVQQRTAELTRSNEELEQFAYVASHDLQAPLRAVSGYISLLDRRYGPKMEAEARELFRYVVDSAQRMHAVIVDLLAYSSTGRGEHVAVPVDCNEVLRVALDNLAAVVRDSGASVQADALPSVAGNPLLLTQVFQNLIGNALKFHGPQPPQVRISAEPRKGEWTFCVADNGIGIAPDQRERIFQVFQRLHTQEEYAGTGIGLAICRKVIQRHGGRIWVESTPDAGSRFYFTLPAVH